jgi:hypothetical protein
MKCLRVYSTTDGESHFDEVEIPTGARQVHPDAVAFEVSASYAATRIRFTRIPAGAGEIGWHTVGERVLTVRLNGSAEYQTSDGDKKHVLAGSFILFGHTRQGTQITTFARSADGHLNCLPQGLDNV